MDPFHVLLFFVLALIVFGVLATSLWRFLIGPGPFPYTMAFLMRLSGRLMQFGNCVRIRTVSRDASSSELINSLRVTAARDLFPLRDSYLALDKLPTVARGKAALGLRSVFDVFVKRVQRLQSPYTHPLQSPPFFIPGVPARPFYDSKEFEFTKDLEAAYPDIRRELENVLTHQSAKFRTYVGGHGKTHEGWNNFFFYLFGRRVDEHAASCPTTMRILDSIPHLERTMAMFAALNPHSGLPPHTGPFNGILRVHLPLIVPKDCQLKVADEVRTWEEGKVMVFDDSFIHSVHNHSDSVRVVLFFTIYHPCLAADEVPVLQRFGDAWHALPVTQLYEKFQHRTRPSNLILRAGEPATAESS